MIRLGARSALGRLRVLRGTHERSGLGGLREMRRFASPDARRRIDAEVDRVIAFHETTTLPLLAPGTR